MPPTEFTVTRDTAVVYKVRGHGEYADAALREWKSGGSITVQSSFGTFAYSWNAIGGRTLRNFLRGLSFDYFMGKTRDAGYQEFDGPATVKAIRKGILLMRRERSAPASAILAAWRAVRPVNVFGTTRSPTDFIFELGQDAGDIEALFGTFADVPWGTRNNANCVAFWEQIWPVLCEEWRKEEEQKTEAA